MPTDQAPPDPTPVEPTAADRTAHDHPADTVCETDPESRESDADGDSEPDSACERDDEPGGPRVAALERRVAELEAEVAAVRGLLDGVAAVDETVERRAAAALAKVEALEERFDPEEGTLVRERLPTTRGDGHAEGVDGDRTGRHRNPRGDADPNSDERPQQADALGRDPGVLDDGRPTGSSNVPHTDSRAPTGMAGGSRAHRDDPNAADHDSTEGGAISSVGADALGGDGAEDADQSLAARLRDAFR